MKAEHWNTDGTLPVFRYRPRSYWAASLRNTGTLNSVLFRKEVVPYKGRRFPVFQCSGSLNANSGAGYSGTLAVFWQCSAVFRRTRITNK